MWICRELRGKIPLTVNICQLADGFRDSPPAGGQEAV